MNIYCLFSSPLDSRITNAEQDLLVIRDSVRIVSWIMIMFHLRSINVVQLKDPIT